MKKIKKLLFLALACLTCFTVGAFSACGDEDENDKPNTEQGNGNENEDPGEVAPSEYVYKIRTQSEGGFGLRQIEVTLYEGDTKVAAVSTSSEGDAFFTTEEVSTPGNYRIELSNVPQGWRVKNGDVTYQTSTVSGSNITINFTASLITDGEKTSASYYKLGDVAHDFSAVDSTGKTYTLSEILTEKKMVMLNLWATWCGPCASEFPPMEQAYKMYQDDVEILAFSTDSSDTQTKVQNYKIGKELTFPMFGSPDSTPVANDYYDNNGVPVTIIIDRYGVISYKHTGNMVAISDFTSLFDKFVGDDYVQTVIDGKADSDDGNNGGIVEQTKPNVSNPDLEEVKKAFSGKDSDFEYRWETDDEYAWPWLIAKDGDKSYLTVSNQFVDNSYSILNIDFTADANTALAFDYKISTEELDYLYVLIDGTITHSIAGVQGNWTTCYSYVFEEEHAGEHTLSLIFMKNSVDSGDDIVNVANLRFESKADIDMMENLDLNILRHAATQWNDPADYQEGDAKTKKYNDYVNVKLGADGYYHVIPDDAAADYQVNLDKDPILFADILNSTHWNKYDIWQLAYNGMLVYQGIDLSDLIENSYAWAASHSANGYVPVTPALREVLDMIMQLKDVIGEQKDNADSATRKNYFDPTCHESYYAEEWLETCVYFDHYGQTPVMEDPTKGITFNGAIEIYEGENHIDVFQQIVPVGIKHKFTPTKSGVYHFYSTMDVKYFGKDAKYNPYMWLVDGDQTTFLAENDDFLLHHTGNPENFDIKYYLEAGKTYYCIFSLFLNELNEFDMKIDYLGTYYENFTNCSIGPYTMNMTTYKVFLPNTQKVAYDATNDVYRITDTNGTFLGELYEGLDDRVYLDLTSPTMLFSSYILADYIHSYEDYETEKRLFYLPDENGNMKDYSPIMEVYRFEAECNNGILNGKIAVNAELMHVLLELTKKYDGFDGVKNSWQMMCYYYQPLGNK